ncbi:ABC transporter substrate-binding protein [Virgibacillus dakarensis]|uniref:Cobalamin-binding protein n=1 Tax=Lentibacillus populi TaxID=1827502 RepID=A0A9W5U2G9_9BACI|nr:MULTISPECIES: cobalamin-binding protein [Bacillaceae]MBT2218243.1 cobalamin-binding protein [Virgibacillus dakarensis]MTW85537.1 ABC transporter substrate-binding protein [Virgibacillus dakarensis]GGB62881.1 cobalamin-binding protein [Lentibacillus populi]
MRVVSICPSNTEIVAYLGKTDLLVGVDNFSDWPDEVSNLPKLGPDLSINMDKVAELDPDLVLASLSVPGMGKNIDALKKQGLPYITLNPNSLEEIAGDIQTVGEALNLPELGLEKAETFRHEINYFQERPQFNHDRPELYWEWWPKPIFTPGKVNWLTELSQLAGARNIFDTEDVASFQTDWDDVKERNPDHICMVWVGVKEEKMRPELVMKRPGWDTMKAVRQGKIHVMEESLYCRPSPRLLEGLRKLDKLIN